MTLILIELSLYRSRSFSSLHKSESLAHSHTSPRMANTKRDDGNHCWIASDKKSSENVDAAFVSTIFIMPLISQATNALRQKERGCLCVQLHKRRFTTPAKKKKMPRTNRENLSFTLAAVSCGRFHLYLSHRFLLLSTHTRCFSRKISDDTNYLTPRN